MGYQPKVYRKQGGDEQVVADGGKITIESGGTLELKSGWVFSGSGLATAVADGLGASQSYTKTTDGAQTLLAANSSGDGARVVLGVVTVDEAFSDGEGGTQPVFIIGETGTTNKFLANTVLVGASLGDTFFFAGVLTEETALLVTGTPAVGVGTGGCSVTVLALPQASVSE